MAQSNIESAADQSSTSFTASSPKIELPKGGGAIRGIGEKFAANPVTGTGSTTVPIATSSGRSGFGPQLSLAYDSGAGNGPFGFGWNLSLPSITRKTDKGLPQYMDETDSDEFILSGAEDLVPVLMPDDSRFEDTTTVAGYIIHRYRPRIEGLFARIERWTYKPDGEVHWRSISKDNILTLYGKDANSRIADPENSGRIFSWLICETRDDKGNAVVYEYKEEDGAGVTLSNVHEVNRGAPDDIRRTANRYIKYIRYGNRTTLLNNTGHRPHFLATPLDNSDWMFEVVFDYDEHDALAPSPDDTGEWAFREDAFSNYRAGFEVRTTRLCQRVLMFHHIPDISANDKGYDGLVRSTDFTYSHEQDPSNARNPVYTFLCTVNQIGYRRNNSGYDSRSLPPLEFEYSQPKVQDKVEEVDPASLENLPIGVDGATYQWTDLHGEGIPGILTEQANTWFYKRNFSPINKDKKIELTPLEPVNIKPKMALADGAQFMDLAGDGQPDLVMLDEPVPGFYEHDGEESWQAFRPFISRLNRDMRDPNLKFIDLNGDGHADVLISEDDAFVWHASLAEAGFGPARRVAQALDEDKGPRLIFADGTQSIYLADLSGDGLTDLVRIRNGEVCYWPNMGYCRFGAKVTMDHSPYFDTPDQFDHKRIRLADIDGTGTTDIIYLHADGVHLYFNQSGNSWSKDSKLNVFPHVDNVVSITTTDLYGNGTACLVWSSPLPGDTQQPMRYVNLMGEQKPHLLIKTVTNLGAETRVHYASSIKFFLQDKRDGKPWITRLPFPVHVVERLETFDHISRNRFVTRYAYHHGYFDGEEREFRGFGMVEQWDTEDITALSNSDEFPVDDNVDDKTHVPPVHTKTWFHTGVYLGRGHTSDYFAGLLNANDKGEYFRELGLTDAEASSLGLDDKARHLYDDAQARKLLLNDTVLPDDLTIDEEREACRALKGSMLRQEVYADDGTDKQEYPYTVTEQNFTIRPIQHKINNRHAVFLTHAREVINYHYERNPEDPRIQHALTLEVDDYGNIRKSLAVGYGRRPGMNPLRGDDKNKQEQVLITYTENKVTNAIDDTVKNPDGSVKYPNDYHTPLPSEVRSYELTGLEPDNGAQRFSFDKLIENNFKKIEDLTGVPYQEPVDYAASCKRLIEHVRSLYRSDNMDGLLDLNELQPLALPGESYKLAFTPGLINEIYQRDGQALLLIPEDVLEGTGADKGGYVHSEGDTNWWIPSGRIFYREQGTPTEEYNEAKDHFFLPRCFEDPFGNKAYVRYARDLLVLETEDALGNKVSTGERDVNTNVVTPGIDYRVLQPASIMGPNRNLSRVTFDVLGLVVATAVMGKPEDIPVKGDVLDATLATDLNQQQIDDFDNDPLGQPAFNLLANATSRVVYDIDRFYRTSKTFPEDKTKWQAGFASSIVRETHVSELPADRKFKIQVSFSYSDGFGREIQKKIQAEPGSVEEGGPIIDPRWVGSGWTIFNNKGKPVRQYEPFFTDTHQFEFARTQGVSPILFYDPVERVVATLHPNHTYEKVVFDPWQQVTYDVNDTVTFDPQTDGDVKGFLLNPDATPRIAVSEYLPTWHQLRTDPSHAAEFATLYPDATNRSNETIAANKATAHADTPTTAHFDALGRPFLTIAHNKVVCPNHTLDGTEDKFQTRIELDIEGNQRAVRDAETKAWDAGGNEIVDELGRIVMQYDYTMVGPEQNEEGEASNRIHQFSMEAGARWVLNDILGNPIRSWDGRGHSFITEYDTLRRSLRTRVIGADPDNPANEFLTQRVVYGEQHPQAVQLNLCGRLYLHLDQAGAVTTDAVDFKGNPLQAARRLAREYKQPISWLAVDASLPGNATAPFNPVNLEAALTPLLEGDTYTSHTSYDALNRPLTATSPDGSIYHPSYNEANLLQKVDVNLRGAAEATSFVINIDYDAKGQRTLIEYGCGATGNPHGVTTNYDFDSLTFRLESITTTRPANLNGLATQLFKDPVTVQDIHYTYDPVGNITHIADNALKTIHHNGERIDPICNYTYDALYRLIEAAGREHIGQSTFLLNPPNGNLRDFPVVGANNLNNTQALRNYTEQYEYDAVGNFEATAHQANNGTWTRVYEYDEASLIEANKKSNRLSKAPLQSAPPTAANDFIYDPHGSMTKMPHLPLMQWDYRDQLQATAQQVINNGTPETTWYVYDASGQRVRKVTESMVTAVGLANGEQPVRLKERIYLGGFEIYREYENDGVTPRLERESLHIMDDKQRIALIETKTIDNSNPVNTPAPLQRYQLGNHLGSSTLELAENGELISYEEYRPYGTSAFQAGRSAAEVSLKRYRYSGKERDEESGLYYYGARYYAGWLGRWLSADYPVLLTGLFLSNSNNFSSDYDMGEDKSNITVAEDVHVSPHELENIETKNNLISLYVYVECNPINWIDKNGMDREKPKRRDKSRIKTGYKQKTKQRPPSPWTEKGLKVNLFKEIYSLRVQYNSSTSAEKTFILQENGPIDVAIRKYSMGMEFLRLYEEGIEIPPNSVANKALGSGGKGYSDESLTQMYKSFKEVYESHRRELIDVLGGGETLKKRMEEIGDTDPYFRAFWENSDEHIQTGEKYKKEIFGEPTIFLGVEIKKNMPEPEDIKIPEELKEYMRFDK